jgi:Pentapeptide repeats (8 copies)
MRLRASVLHVLTRWAAWPRGIRWLAGGTVAVVLALVVAWVLFVPTADWLAHHDVGSGKGLLLLTARDAARSRLLTLGAGLFAAGALVFTARNFTLSRDAQVTDRYTKAIDQLGSEKLDVRVGGIYALQRVARVSASDHPTVMEVLAAFIREHSREEWPVPEPDISPARAHPFPRPDVQSALTVIGRRDVRRDRQRIDLTAAVLPGALLFGADLTRVRLVDADLRGAKLTGANLTNADFTSADLTDALWAADAVVPEGWQLDATSGRLKRADTNSGEAPTS